MINIEDGVALPVGSRAAYELFDAMKRMDVGQSFVTDYSMGAFSIAQYSIRLVEPTRKYTSRFVEAGKRRVWRVS